MIKKIKLSITTDGSGTATAVTNDVAGTIEKVTFLKGTVDAACTATVTITESLEVVVAQNVNAATATSVYPVVAVAGASAGDNKWGKYVVAGTLTVTVAGSANEKTFTIYIYVNK